MAIDANTGAVLHNQSGDAPRYPASLTKMMTLYMTFELIELGRLSYTSNIRITEEAAAAAPSKLDLEPGEEIALLDAIKALITKSANDVAIALAQNIAGSEQNFARLMTAKAQQLGMTQTTFKNASGLPDEEQTTTARDMLTLALRLQDDFPRHYRLFATRTFTYGGRTYRNHNTLLSRYEGTDGIKTGYTRGSGFNLVTSVRRDGKHVVAAVFGGKTAKLRNAKMQTLLNSTLAKASTKATRKPAPVVRAPQPILAKPPVLALSPSPAQKSDAPPPSAVDFKPVAAKMARDEAAPTIAVAKVRPVLLGPRKEPNAAAINALPVFASASASANAPPRIAAASSAPRTRSGGGPQASQPVGSLPSTLQAQAEVLERGGPHDAPVADMGVQAARPMRQAAREAPGTFEIQIGAYSDTAEAERHIASARQRAGGLLDPYRSVAVPVQTGSNQLYRARFRGFDATAAASTCLHLRRLQIDCFVVNTQ